MNSWTPKCDPLIKQSTRRDSPIQMLLDYQEQFASLIELQDNLVDINAYNLEKIFDLAWPHLNYIVPELAGGGIIGCLDKKIKSYAHKDNSRFIKKWMDVNSESKELILAALEKDTKRSVILWNYNSDAPLFVSDSRMNQTVALAWLCEKPDDEALYTVLVRNISKRPFLCHEVQAIKLAARIIGSRANFTFTYEALLGGISKTVRGNY
ncbi:hypothetical protein QUF75_13520 [Desulfococcaceae bacterium HSG7]|nr:hypothetical protein [Desulfococcaceae bacterium HSG7]